MRSLTRRVLGALIAASLVGCTPPPPKPIAKPEPKFSNRTESPDPVSPESEAKGFTPDDTGAPSAATLLAQKLAAYSREVSPNIKKRNDQQKLASTTRPAATPSDVKWAGGDGTGPAAVPGNPSPAKPADLAGGTNANQVVALNTNVKSGDVPQIVPEGEDLVANTGPHEAIADTDALLAQLSGKIKENPKDLSAQLDFQLIQFLRGEQVPQMKSISGLGGEDREVLTALLDGLSNFRSNIRNDSNQMLSEKIRPLVEMADRLRGQADLTLPTAALCTRVDGYGVYEPITPAHFGAGKDHPVIVYCEVANFASQMNEKKQWETKLSNEIILYTETGMAAWSDKSKSIVDLSRNRRHDFFIVKKTKLPATLPMGRYILKISVTDQQSNRVAETTVPVEILAE